MTDKEIDKYLKEIINKPFEVDAFKTFKYPYNGDLEDEREKTKDEKEKELSDKFKKTFNYDYLCNEVKLLKTLNKNDGIVFFKLTKKGRKVVRLGGWLKYLEIKDKIEKRKERKEIAELKISEFQANNPRLPYYISICGVVISFFVFIRSCKTSDKQTLPHKQDINLYILGDTIATKKGVKQTIDIDSLKKK